MGQIGVVDQEPVLFAGSIADNICYGVPSATSLEVEEAARQVLKSMYGTVFGAIGWRPGLPLPLIGGTSS